MKEIDKILEQIEDCVTNQKYIFLSVGVPPTEIIFLSVGVLPTENIISLNNEFIP